MNTKKLIPLRIFLVLVMLINSAVLSGPVSAQTLNPIPKDQALQNLQSYMRFIGSLRAQLDRTQFDTDALLDELDYDLEKIEGFVRGEIGFEPYGGLLRGPLGTLLARGGNTLDQAVLLAKLLNDAGYETRVAHCQIDRSQATRLLAQISKSQPSTSPFKDPRKVSEIFHSYLGISLGAGETDEILAFLTAEEEPLQLPQPVVAQAEIIQEQSRVDGSAIQEKKIEQLSAQTEQYFWVQIKEGTISNWRDLHPAISDESQDPTTCPPEGYFSGNVPPNLHHKLRLKVQIVQRVRDQFSHHTVMPTWEVPTANLVGEVVTFTNLPNLMSSDQHLADPDAAVENSTYFVPLLNGKIPPGASAFNTSGVTFPPDAVASSYSGIFQTVSSKAESAIAALDRLGEPESLDEGTVDPIRSLASQELQVEFEAPDGEIRSKTHRIAAASQNESPKNQDQPSINKLLAEERAFMVSVGRMPDSFVLEKTFERILGANELIRSAIELAYSEEKDFSILDAGDANLSWGGHLELYSSFDSYDGDPSTLIYRDRPALVLHTRDLTSLNNGREVLDIFWSPITALSVDSNALTFDHAAVIRRGVWESYVEGHFISRGDVLAKSAFNDFERLMDESGRFEAITYSNTDSIDKLNASTETKRAMLEDVRNGYTLVIAQPTRDKQEMTSWYRVDPHTAETLGMLESGIGGSITEYVIVTIAVAIGLIVFRKTLQACMAVEGPGHENSPLGVNYSQLDESQKNKFLGCGICAAFAGAVAGLLAYTVGSIAAYEASFVSGLSQASILQRLQLIAEGLAMQGVQTVTIKQRVMAAAGSFACATISADM